MYPFTATQFREKLKRTAMAADYSCKTVDPTNPRGERIDAIFPGDLTLRMYKYSPVQYENLRAAKFVLENARRIFFGIREFNDGGWCYTARPVEWHVRPNVIAPFPENLIYAVYVNPNMRVYEWRAEPVDEDDPFCPDDWQNRYRGMTWKNTS